MYLCYGPSLIKIRLETCVIKDTLTFLHLYSAASLRLKPSQQHSTRTDSILSTDLVRFGDTSPVYSAVSFHELVIVLWSDAEGYCLSAGAPACSGTESTGWTWARTPGPAVLRHLTHGLLWHNNTQMFLLFRKDTAFKSEN